MMIGLALVTHEKVNKIVSFKQAGIDEDDVCSLPNSVSLEGKPI